MLKKLLAATLLITANLAGAAVADDTVKFGGLRVPAPAFAGIEKGFFKQEGIDASIVMFKSGAEIAPAVATGQVDAAMTTSGAALYNAMARGIHVTIVADVLSLEPNAPGGDPTAIIARKDLIKSPADLRGKRIAFTAPGQIHDIIVSTYLAQHGIPRDAVRFVTMPLPDMVPAFSNGAIDAAVMIDPFVSTLVAQGDAHVLARASEVIPNASQAFLIFSDKLMQNRGLAVRLLRAYLKSNSWVRERLGNPEGRRELAVIFNKIAPEKDSSIYERIPISTASEKATVNTDGEYGLRWQLKHLTDRGLIQGNPRLDDHLNETLLKQALGAN